ncbi:MAG: hypothetical protein ACXABG_12350, partial [Promethearchaeota archaeon]
MNQTRISSKQLGMIVLIDLISVLFWAISMVLNIFTGGAINTRDEVIDHVSNQSIFFFLNYLNAIIFT